MRKYAPVHVFVPWRSCSRAHSPLLAILRQTESGVQARCVRGLELLSSQLGIGHGDFRRASDSHPSQNTHEEGLAHSRHQIDSAPQSARLHLGSNVSQSRQVAPLADFERKATARCYLRWWIRGRSQRSSVEHESGCPSTRRPPIMTSSIMYVCLVKRIHRHGTSNVTGRPANSHDERVPGSGASAQVRSGSRICSAAVMQRSIFATSSDSTPDRIGSASTLCQGLGIVEQPAGNRIRGLSSSIR